MKAARHLGRGLACAVALLQAAQDVLVVAFFMGRVLVDEQHRVAELDDPVGAEDLADDAVLFGVLRRENAELLFGRELLECRELGNRRRLHGRGI